MNLSARIKAFVKLGEYLKIEIYDKHEDQIKQAEVLNPWFTRENIAQALSAYSTQLQEDMLFSWLSPYKVQKVKESKTVLVVMAGNIPLVGFSDFLAILISGHKVIVKMSGNDNILLKLLVDKLISIDPYFKDTIKFIDDVKGKEIDAVIATGSDNSSEYFEYYFKDLKKIIRKNRRSIAILDGTESDKQLNGLAKDVFSYFGLGCRNVSKLFLPNKYDLNKLFQVFYPYNKIIEHKKYLNNYEYNKAIFLMGGNKLIENGFLLMKEDDSLFSPVAMLYYEYYDDINNVSKFIQENSNQIQCVVSKDNILFGNSQQPHLWDYADGIDTIQFLKNL